MCFFFNFIYRINNISWQWSKIAYEFNLDIIFSSKIDLLDKIEKSSFPLGSLYECNNACATSDCYILKDILDNSSIFNNETMYKVVNTGTLDKYNSKWGIKEMKYLKDKYLYPVVSKKQFHETFPNAYGKKVGKSKIIIKGMTLFAMLFGKTDFVCKLVPSSVDLVS